MKRNAGCSNIILTNIQLKNITSEVEFYFRLSLSLCPPTPHSTPIPQLRLGV
jgi:hypothetical protein